MNFTKMRYCLTYAPNYTLVLGIYVLELFYIRDDVVIDLKRPEYVSNASVFFYKILQHLAEHFAQFVLASLRQVRYA